MKEILTNIYSSSFAALLIIFVIAFIYTLTVQPSRIKNWLLYACFDAEKLYGSKTGDIKRQYVYTLFTKKFSFLSNFITYKKFCKMLDTVLEILNDLIKNNKSIKDLIDPLTMKLKNEDK